jgi:hypothetical protein
MEAFVHHENLEQFATLLGSDPTKRSTLMTLLIEEENKFGAGYERLDAADQWVAAGRDRIEKQRDLIARLSEAGHDMATAHQQLRGFMEIQSLFEGYRRHLAARLEWSPWRSE